MCFRLAFISVKHSIFHDFDANLAPFSVTSCLTPSLCVFCRNKENKTKIKQFGKDLKKLCKEKDMVATTKFYGCDHKILWPRP